MRVRMPRRKSVERALVRLVHDYHVVGAQKRVVARLGEQHAVRHELDARVARDAAVEAVLVSDERADFALHFGGDAFGHCDGGEAARLCACHAAASESARKAVFEGHLRKLGGLAGAGVAANDYDGTALQRGKNLVAVGAHRKLGRI